MGSLNLCTFIGNLGRDAELKYTPGGDAVATISIACSESWKDKSGQKQERTEWVRVVLWGKTAEALAPYLTKGKQIYVAGKLTTRKWEDKSGNERYTTEIRGERVVLLGGGGERRQDGPAHLRDEDVGRAEPTKAYGDRTYDPDDDIPF